VGKNKSSLVLRPAFVECLLSMSETLIVNFNIGSILWIRYMLLSYYTFKKNFEILGTAVLLTSAFPNVPDGCVSHTCLLR
jgi:hypothetical protein